MRIERKVHAAGFLEFILSENQLFSEGGPSKWEGTDGGGGNVLI